MFKKIVDKIIELEVERRKQEIEMRLSHERDKLQAEYQMDMEELSALKNKLNFQIDEIEKTRQKAEEEEKRLWRGMDILKENLNSDQVWSRVWESAFQKAAEIVWEIMKKKTLDLIELAKNDAYVEAEVNAGKNYQKKLDEFINKSTDSINIPLLYKLRDEARNKYLIAQRSKDIPNENFYLGQIKLIEAVIK